FRLMGSVANASVLVAVYLGTRQVLDHTLSVGELVALVEYMALLAWPTLSLGWMLSLWQRGRAAMSRLNEVMDRAPAIASGPQAPHGLVPHLELRDLSLHLGGRLVLDRVNLRIDAGRTVGIVGPIGAGKSLLIQALLRLMEVQPGQVFVGGHDVASLDLATLRRTFGYVPQNHMLFSKTLAENVAFGRPEAAPEAIRAAVSTAALTPDLAALPQGLDTPVGERGITLSGGQKQRTAMARALLVDPPILILDDALSSVDAETEAAILRNLRSERAGRTTLIVAHRPSAVRHADFIVVMDAGKVIEQGSHAALVRQGGAYARLARRQELEAQLEGATPAQASPA
ncbi:MAG: ABC transporter ATP-binding protein, partial [Deltaproteobacteria bacterium]|nr:ABC transporter ATP-binding protein [Deltaproteobacteria bacterium]